MPTFGHMTLRVFNMDSFTIDLSPAVKPKLFGVGSKVGVLIELVLCSALWASGSEPTLGVYVHAQFRPGKVD